MLVMLAFKAAKNGSVYRGKMRDCCYSLNTIYIDRCTKALLINNGKQVDFDTLEIINKYYNFIHLSDTSKIDGKGSVGSETLSLSFLPSL